MSPDEFRRHAHTMVDWMADYMEGVEAYPVRAQTEPGAIAAQLPGSAPESGESFESIFADFQRIVMPGMTHWQHPAFHAYFPANSSPPSVLAEMLTATLAAQCMLWQTSPAATELEVVVLDWLRKLLGLPEGLAGVIQDSASSATLCAILTARERATDWRINADGPGAGPPVIFYASANAHSSIDKAIRIAGVGINHLRKLPVDDSGAMIPSALQAAVDADRAAGVVPAGVITCLGSTGTGAVDDLVSIGAICQAENLYLHVDAAWAGSALILPEQRWMIAGIELADSFVFNPHKWLLTNFDCSAHYVRDPEPLIRTLSILPAYLKSRETGSVIDFRDWGIPLGRRFRALKLWFVLRSYGAEALREMLRSHISLTEELAGWIRASPDFTLVDGPRLALLNFRYTPAGVTDEAVLTDLNTRLVERINDTGLLYLTGSRIAEMKTIRFSIGQRTTVRRHVVAGWATIQEVAATLRG
ncbi:MAG: pyridoxal-dependent decarboxylase [Myxococcota bacterium]|nr:pyridoxal-dependent decarboxylase [Myxococcota bacterium]